MDTCDTGATKLGVMRTERKHWRAAEKFLAASIVNNFNWLKSKKLELDGGERRKEGETAKESTFSAPHRSDRDADRIGGLILPR